MAHMTGATEATTGARSRHDDLRVSVALVAGVALVHLVMAYHVDAISGAVFDRLHPLVGVEAARLAVSLTAWLPLVLVVLWWGRDRRLARLAGLVAVGFATLGYLRGVIAQWLFDPADQDAVVRYLDWSTWVLTSLIPLGAALVWGIARRRGSAWWPGLLVAAVVASLFRWLDLDAFSTSNLRFAFAALVYHVVPAVLAGLACWWLDAREGDR
jgi:hypothetical protein